MCYFLSIGTKLDPEILRSLAPEGLKIREGRSPSLRKIDPGMPHWVDLTDGRCSCDLCPTPENLQKAADEAERLEEGYRKKGYSEARIERALRAAARAKGAKRRLSPAATTDFLLRLLQRTPAITSFCRWCDGRMDEESVRAEEQITITLARVASVRPGWLPLDTAVRVKA